MTVREHRPIEVVLSFWAAGLGLLSLCLWFWCSSPAESAQPAALAPVVAGLEGRATAELPPTGRSPAGSSPSFEGGFAEDPRDREPALVPAQDAEGAEAAESFATPSPAAHGAARTEKELYEAFLQRAQGQPGSIESVAAGVLADDGSEPEQVALLRALYDTGSEATEQHFLHAVRTLPGVSRPEGESVPSFAVLFLGRRAPRDARARGLLERVAFEAPHPSPELRRRAAASLFAHATEAELRGLATHLERDADPLLVESALEALSRNPDTRAADPILVAFGRPRGPGDQEPAQEP
jgi:hypothetical protein